MYSQVELSGTVKDSVETLAFANVLLQDENGQLITGNITDENGEFKISAEKAPMRWLLVLLGINH